MDPTKPSPASTDGFCDCSGFACWALNTSRRTKDPSYVPRDPKQGAYGWISTSSVWDDAQRTTGMFARCEPKVGAVIVYPDKGGKQGHIGIVTKVVGGRAAAVIHCSTSNQRITKTDAILETAPTVFDARSDTLCAWYSGLTEV